MTVVAVGMGMLADGIGFHYPCTERRDAKGRGDVWGLGLTVLAVINGREPLESCTTRSQVDIELFEAAKECPFPILLCCPLVDRTHPPNHPADHPTHHICTRPKTNKTSAAATGKPSAEVAEARDIFSRRRLRELSPELQDFVDKCV